MQRMDRHALGRCPGRIGQALAKELLPAVTDSDPVHRAQDDGPLSPEDHDAAARERRINCFRRIVCKRTADRRRSINVEYPDTHRRARRPIRGALNVTCTTTRNAATSTVMIGFMVISSSGRVVTCDLADCLGDRSDVALGHLLVDDDPDAGLQD